MSAYRLARVTLVCFAWYALIKSAMLALLWEYGLVGHTSGVFAPVGVGAGCPLLLLRRRVAASPRGCSRMRSSRHRS